MNETFREWILEGKENTFLYESGRSQTLFLRMKKNDGFDYLYQQQTHNENFLERGEGFKYAGFYHKKESCFYDASYALQEISSSHGFIPGDSLDVLHRQLEMFVRQAVEAAVCDDRNNLKVQSVQDTRHKERLDYYIRYRASERAREMFLQDTDVSDICYHCDHCPERWTEDSLLEYLSGRRAYADKEAAAYMENNQEEMLLKFLENDALLAEYEKILANPLWPIRRIKAIMAAMSASSAKTAHVTLRCDGKELTFKMEADTLRRDCGSHYSSYHIAAADRGRFEEVFGRHADIKPEHNTRITYGRQTLYEAE